MQKLQYKKRFIIPVIVLTMLAGALMSSSVQAQTKTQEYPPLVQKLAERFGLDEQEVRQVFDEMRSERHAEQYMKIEEKLAKAVEAGQLTEAQKEAILEKYQELQEKHQENSQQFFTLTPQERKEVRRREREELRAWAEELGINPQFLRYGVGMKHRGDGFMRQQ